MCLCIQLWTVIVWTNLRKKKCTFFPSILKHLWHLCADSLGTLCERWALWEEWVCCPGICQEQSCGRLKEMWWFAGPQPWFEPRLTITFNWVWKTKLWCGSHYLGETQLTSGSGKHELAPKTKNRTIKIWMAIHYTTNTLINRETFISIIDVYPLFTVKNINSSTISKHTNSLTFDNFTIFM